MANATDLPRSDPHSNDLSGARPVHRAVLLYDGECGFCAGSVQFMLARESAAAAERLAFAPLQGPFGAGIRERFPELEGVDSVVWYDPTGPSVRVRSSAALAAATHLGGVWAALAMLGRLVPRALLDAMYDMFARRRFELAAPACLLPTADQRARFLP